MDTPGMSKTVDKKKSDPKVNKTSDEDSNEENKNAGSKCAFCGSAEDNERNFGKIIEKSGLTVHYFCMLFSCALNQRGKNEKQGILGFLVEDIKRELRRGLKLKCCYCKRAGATIGCAIRKCGKKFHLHCGLQHETLNQFFGSFCAFCADHRPVQKFPASLSDQVTHNHPPSTNCPICLCSVEPKICFQTLRAPCCKNAWFHRNCVQDQALNAGYFFKCPLCNNKDVYESEMLTQGIYIPEQDASWEMDPEAFQDLLHRHDRCDLPQCLCADGRMHDLEGSRWEIILCALCGHQGCHISCGRLSFYKPYWECSLCQEILNTKSFIADNTTFQPLKKCHHQVDTSIGPCAEKRVKHPRKARKRKSDEYEEISPESPALGSAPCPKVLNTWSSSQIMERILQCQAELESNFKLLESLSNSNSSDESSANYRPEKPSIVCASPVPSTSTSSASTGSSQKSAYISDGEVDVVQLKDPAEGGASSGSEIEVVGEFKLRLSPSDFPSPHGTRLAVCKGKKHWDVGPIPEEQQEPLEDSFPAALDNDAEAPEAGEHSDHPQITCYLVRDVIDASANTSALAPNGSFDLSGTGAYMSDVSDQVTSGDQQTKNVPAARHQPMSPIGLATQVYLLEEPKNAVIPEPPCLQPFLASVHESAGDQVQLSGDDDPVQPEGLAETAGTSEYLDVIEVQPGRLSREEGHEEMLDCRLRSDEELAESDVELMESVGDSSTDFTMSGPELGSLISRLDHSIEWEDVADDSVVCLSESKPTVPGKQEVELEESCQECWPLDMTKENLGSGLAPKRSKKKKRKQKRKRRRQKQDVEDGRDKKHGSKHRNMQRCLTSLELGGGNKPTEYLDLSEASLSALMEVADEHENKPTVDGLSHCRDVAQAAEGFRPMKSSCRPSASWEVMADIDNEVEIIDLVQSPL